MSQSFGYIENENVKLWVEDGILFECIKTNHISLKIAREIVQERLKLSNGVTMPAFIYTDSKKFTTMDKDAREYFSTEESLKYLSASAMIVDNYARLMLGKLFVAFGKPTIPVEIFKSEKKALEWLEKFK